MLLGKGGGPRETNEVSGSDLEVRKETRQACSSYMLWPVESLHEGSHPKITVHYSEMALVP